MAGTNTKSSTTSGASGKGGTCGGGYNQFQQMCTKNLESATAANQVALEGWQSIARCGSDAAQNQIRQGVNLWRHSATGFNSPAETQEQMKDFVSHSIQNYYNTINNVMEACTETATNLVSVCGEGCNGATKEWISSCNNWFNQAANSGFSGFSGGSNNN